MTIHQATQESSGKDLDVLLEQAKKASDLLKALSHETRLVILCILSEGEKSVSELEEILSMPQAAVSQQLARLRLEGLVQSRRDGRAAARFFRKLLTGQGREPRRVAARENWGEIEHRERNHEVKLHERQVA